jgi:pimeloyl-ACP methyl ester carboxylesterase
LLGEKDKTGKVKAGKVKVYNKMWTKQTGYDLIVIKNAGHNANVDNPTAVNNEIELFTARLDD